MPVADHDQGSRSPLDSLPLRYPGQSLDEQIDALAERVLESLLVPALALAAALGSWLTFFGGTLWLPLILSAFGAAGVFWCWRKFPAALRERDNLRLGRNGERKVGQYLEYLRRDGYRVYHDITNGDHNIDHAIIGPAGVFTIETKTISKPKRGQAEIVYDGVKVLVNGLAPDRDPLPQALAQAREMRQLLRDVTGKDLRVCPVVVYPGWFVNYTGHGTSPDVRVMNPGFLPHFLPAFGKSLTTDEVEELGRMLDAALSKRETERGNPPQP